ncbi:Protein of unknown function [Streptomyces zhaozhouensis]|uniref:DUF4232 domain-containing protein n=1 Tax=Streptomyces zhaozhouensis TaxID=1300267 RepID=A0A286DXE5_9ACTN|nr:DUF4232 domain-containing protein [Streptomyces zhaozhouensis]SOD63224.1 Protein of unknown function [Streptomyces zhaozhouensis]
MKTRAPHRRSRVRTAAVAALGVALTMASLTACQDDDKDDANASPSQSSSTDSGDSGDSDGAAEEGEDGTEDAAGDDTEGDGNVSVDPGAADDEESGGEPEATQPEAGEEPREVSSEEAAEFPPCAEGGVELKVTPVERPINHMLLTVTNTGDETCAAYHAPLLRLGEDAQAPAPRNEDSKPQSVIVLDPGQVAYAGLLTSDASGDSGEGHTIDSLGVTLTDRDDQPTGGQIDVPLPGGEIHVDDAAQVTYWQSSLDNALY